MLGVHLMHAWPCNPRLWGMRYFHCLQARASCQHRAGGHSCGRHACAAQPPAVRQSAVCRRICQARPRVSALFLALWAS